MGRFRGIAANMVGALLGTVTPFCSCSSIPIFMGFTSAGLPLGVTFSFLISSPMVDLGSLVLLVSIFGVKIAAAYVVLGLVIAVLGGTLIEHLHMEDQIADFIRNNNSKIDIEAPDLTVKDRMIYAKDQVVSTFKKVFKVLGGGCKSCEALLKAVKEAVGRKGVDAEIAYITDMEKIIGYGVMRMPRL